MLKDGCRHTAASAACLPPATGARQGVIDSWERPDESLRAIAVSDHVDGAMFRTNEAVSAIVHSAGNETVRTIIHSAWHDHADAE
jgi:hypothetical protein